MKSLTTLVQPLRHRLGEHARSRVLAIGDSHVRIFEHWRFVLAFPRTYFDVVYVPGGTATGIRKRHSQTNAYNRFVEALRTRPHDLVLLNLGEVDAAHTIWVRAERDGRSVDEMLEHAVTSYCAFIDEVRAEHPLVVLSAPLPTVPDQGTNPDQTVAPRAAVHATQAERTELTLAFNRRVREHCARSSVRYLGSDRAALGPDGLVRPSWVNPRRIDHHYARGPYARWLIGALRGVLADVAPSGARPPRA